MTHYPNLEPAVRDRLASRGIDPEASTSAMLLAIREGTFALASPRRIGILPGTNLTRWQAGIPLAVVLTPAEAERRRKAAA